MRKLNGIDWLVLVGVIVCVFGVWSDSISRYLESRAPLDAAQQTAQPVLRFHNGRLSR